MSHARRPRSPTPQPHHPHHSALKHLKCAGQEAQYKNYTTSSWVTTWPIPGNIFQNPDQWSWSRIPSYSILVLKAWIMPLTNPPQHKHQSLALVQGWGGHPVPSTWMIFWPQRTASWKPHICSKHTCPYPYTHVQWALNRSEALLQPWNYHDWLHTPQILWSSASGETSTFTKLGDIQALDEAGFRRTFSTTKHVLPNVPSKSRKETAAWMLWRFPQVVVLQELL